MFVLSSLLLPEQPTSALRTTPMSTYVAVGPKTGHNVCALLVVDQPVICAKVVPVLIVACTTAGGAGSSSQEAG